MCFLCLPSPACGPMVGDTVTETQEVERRWWTVGGDVVCGLKIRGGGWRVNHEATPQKTAFLGRHTRLSMDWSAL